MSSDTEPTQGPAPEKPTDALAEKAKATYEWWDNLATLNADDPVWLFLPKILARLLGILILLALSPLILFGILIAFLAVA